MLVLSAPGDSTETSNLSLQLSGAELRPNASQQTTCVATRAGILGSQSSFFPLEESEMTWIDWYNSLAKPSWTPAPATIGLVWQILYPIILATFGFVFFQAARGKLPWMVALPFAINLVANVVFTPIQFGMRNLPMAAIDIVIVWGTILWAAAAVWKHHPWIAVAQIPYFVWVSIATVLQISITAMNWGR